MIFWKYISESKTTLPVEGHNFNLNWRRLQTKFVIQLCHICFTELCTFKKKMDIQI